MSSNRHARQKLERIFGKICFIEELGIRNIPIEKRRKIKGYTKYDDVLTFHHIHEKAKGGTGDPENGALVRGYNHRWLHSLPEEQKEKVNNCMVEFKAAFIQHNGQEIIANDAIKFKLDFDPKDCIEIPVFPNTKEDELKRKKYNRAQVKREFRDSAEEALYLFEHPEERDEDDYTWDWDR